MHPLSKVFIFLNATILMYKLEFFVLPGVFLFLVFVLIYSGLTLEHIIKKSFFLIYLILFSLCAGSFEFEFGKLPHFVLEDFNRIAQYSAQLMLSFLLAEFVFTTTKISELTDMIALCTQRIPLVKKLDPGLYISIIMKFIPAIFSEYKQVGNSLYIKGGKKLKNPIKKSLILFLPLLINMLRKSIITANALKNRGYSYKRTIIIRKITKMDIVHIFISTVPSLLLWIQFVLFQES